MQCVLPKRRVKFYRTTQRHIPENNEALGLSPAPTGFLLNSSTLKTEAIYCSEILYIYISADNEGVTIHLHLVPKSKIVKLCLQFSIRLYGMALN
jgi:hypothetical protein